MRRFLSSLVAHLHRQDPRRRSRPCDGGALLRAVLPSIALGLLVSLPATGQEVIVHRGGGVQYEDGDPRYDADGVKNGVVVFKGGGTVHVITGYGVHTQQTLKIEPGAIVKIAQRVDTIGGHLIWSPPSYGFEAITVEGNVYNQNPGVLQIDGATITDIRDDEVGGDTNQDGSASVPPGPKDIGPYLKIGGNSQSYIKNSTLKYVRGIREIASTKITGNHFVMFESIVGFNTSSSSIAAECLEAVPEISNNVFEFASYRYYGSPFLDLRGLSPVVQGNTFRYAAGYEMPPNFQAYDPVIWIGLLYWRGGYLPKSGTTQIRGNLFQTGAGVKIVDYPDYRNGQYVSGFALARFQAEISSNHFENPADIGNNGGTCFVLPIGAEALVSNNTATNYDRALMFDAYYQSNGPSRVVVNGNRFEQCRIAYISTTSPLSKAVRINAKNNYWGDPTGPYDNSNADGLYNPRGKGLTIVDGIDYIPFIGGTTPPQTDAVQLSASSTPVPPLLPNATVTLNAAVSYQLKSAPTGRILVSVQDKDGIVLNSQDQPVAVTSQNSIATIPPIQIKVPELGNLVTVEAVLAPDVGGQPVSSNIVPFTVASPTSAFTLLGFRDADSGGVPLPVRGNILKVKMDFRYTYAAGNVVVELAAAERMMGNGTILANFPSASAVFPAGTDRADSMALTVDLPLKDVTLFPRTDLNFGATMKTEGGSVIGKQGMAFLIDPGGSVRVEFFAPAGAVGGQLIPLGRDYYRVGEYGAYAVRFGYTIRTRNVIDWQIWCGRDEALDAGGNTLYRFNVGGPAITNASTGSRTGLVKSVGSTTPLPSGTRKHRAHLELVGSGNTLVAFATQDVEVRDEPALSAARAVIAGPSEVAFKPIPATLTFSSNMTPGTAFADEYSRQFGAAAALGKSNMLQALNGFYWNFIPLKRYWSVYDTLQDGTFSATLSFKYDPAADFPSAAGFSEDSLVVAALSPLSNALEALPSTLDKTTHTISTIYSKLFDTWVVASKSTTFVTGISSALRSGLPERCILEQNYPNPFNPSTVIRYGLPHKSQVSLMVYNTLGQQVARLVQGDQEAGYHEVKFEGSGLSSGVYFYRLQAGDFVQTRKLLLIR